jgi:hypothetical protein
MNIVQIAISLLRLESEFDVANAESKYDELKDVDQVTMYTFEPAEDEIETFKQVIRALRPFLDRWNNKWQWCLFTPEGLYECYSDGRNCDPDGNAFKEQRGVWTDEELRNEGVDPAPPKSTST